MDHLRSGISAITAKEKEKAWIPGKAPIKDWEKDSRTKESKREEIPESLKKRHNKRSGLNSKHKK
jgi:hypothetical protein